jgi:L-ascorbate metabolism protein UlaG (beta-lactamase superfamily)
MSAPSFIRLDPDARLPLVKGKQQAPRDTPLDDKGRHTHPRGSSGKEDASVFFIGTATTIIEWRGFRILTDPNFLHAGDHVHLGPGVTAQRQTNPAVELEDLPPIDCVLLSHYHEDHFDRVVEDKLNRSFPIITTPHAKSCLTAGRSQDNAFQAVTGLDFFESALLDISRSHKSSSGEPAIKVTAMPGKHVPPGPLAVANDLLHAVPPTNGWLVELGCASTATHDAGLKVGYRIYISGDTLFVDDLKDIPKHLNNKPIDLMLVHLGGTTIPGPSLPLLMVTMDAKQGLQLLHLVNPEVTIPIHFDDYDVFLSPLSDFKKEISQAGLEDRVVYLNRGESYHFTVDSEQI